MAYLTSNQNRIVQQLRQDGQIPDKVVDVVAKAMQYRNAIAPSGMMNRDTAAEELKDAVDALEY